MTETHDTDEVIQPKRLGLLAQFAGPDELIAAAEKATDEGYRNVEAYSPFPVIGIDEALKAKGTVLPWIVFAMGLTGCLVGLGMQLYMNAYEFAGAIWGLSGYHYMISGKPGPWSIPAFIPVTFELTILLSAFGAFFGMLVLNKLPRLFNALFRSNRFADATTDGFFLFVEATDSKYADTETEAFLSSIGATGVEAIDEPTSGHALPNLIFLVGAAVGTLALLPPLYLYYVWAAPTSTAPRISFFKDMEDQAKYKAQNTSTLFEDGRSARPPIPGTIARGSGKDDIPLYYGVQQESDLSASNAATPARFAAFSGGKTPARFVQQTESDGSPDAGDAAPGDDGEGQPQDAQPADAGAEGEAAEPNWVAEFPEALKINEAFVERGQQRYNIHCAACHGLAGNGDGLVSQRAQKVSGASWTPPTNLHTEAVVTQPVGRIFDTITNGRRKMPGYAEHITPKDRWAIILYMKALQRSQNAAAGDVPAEVRREQPSAS
ncbi:quinol:electron acceptor oxidoreductase subunit ActD [Botrimarina sp.]|uniref:quinol:electron acceptor oxidoreductase subunit ActD n=1 Tax=Botrimarina sp. TaxID=2795802 RepID=UPI0032EAC7DA